MGAGKDRVCGAKVAVGSGCILDMAGAELVGVINVKLRRRSYQS